MSRRVVVTGVGAVTPLGLDVESTWNKLLRGQSGIGMLTRRNIDAYPAKVAAEVKDFDPTNWIDRKEARRMDRFIHFAVVGAIEAMKDAGVTVGETVDSDRIGVWIGNGVGGLETYEENLRALDKRGYKRVSPFTVPMFITNMASGQVALQFGAQGINGCTVTACASGAHSIGDAFRAIQRGDADVMITGGTEAPITDMGMGAFSSMTALSFNPDPLTACRPFDRNRDGFVIAEGAGILVLEELEHAKARGANIYAEIAGFGANCDAYHITAPSPDGACWVKAMHLAVREAGVSLEDVDYINAHGTSTPYNDKYETLAIKKAFGEHAYRLSVSSTKSMTGHLLGGAGGIEAVFSVLAIKHQIVPPTINYQDADEEMDLDYVPNIAKSRNVKVALSNSFGFGGHNAVLCFKELI